MSSEEIEVKAKALGWVPQETFKGDPERWVDAETYVRRGEEIMPILKANNNKLLVGQAQLQEELRTTKELLKAATESIEALKEVNSTAAKRDVSARKQEVIARLAEAKREGNFEAEAQLTDQLTEINAALRESAAKPPAKPAPAAEAVITPEGQVWLTANPWFGTDRRRTGFAMGVAEELRTQGVKPGSAEFYEKIGEEVDKQFGSTQQRRAAAAKVGESNGSGGETGGRGKSYADLPKEAKEVCERQAARLVGPGRAFKTKAEWQSHYVNKYFEE
jgi:hypothetical protein